MCKALNRRSIFDCRKRCVKRLTPARGAAGAVPQWFAMLGSPRGTLRLAYAGKSLQSLCTDLPNCDAREKAG
jgi:hypothetical protein